MWEIFVLWAWVGFFILVSFQSTDIEPVLAYLATLDRDKQANISLSGDEGRFATIDPMEKSSHAARKILD
jgi:hypothetical protein